MAYESSTDLFPIQKDVLTANTTSNNLISNIRQLKTNKKYVTGAINDINNDIQEIKVKLEELDIKMIDIFGSEEEGTHGMQGEIYALQSELIEKFNLLKELIDQKADSSTSSGSTSYDEDLLKVLTVVDNNSLTSTQDVIPMSGGIGVDSMSARKVRSIFGSGIATIVDNV